MKIWSLVLLGLLSCGAVAQEVTFHGKVEVVHRSRHKTGSGDVVVWLTPLSPIDYNVAAPTARLVQKDKRFTPHVVAVQVGSEIEFPNRDPFFHDVFSIYRGKPFDLGLYESGSTRKVRFSQTGVSYIFCNIHPEMSAAVVAVPTPFHAVTDADGSFQLSQLRPGRYKMGIWYELASESELASLGRELEIDSEPTPIAITLHSSDISAQHLNKYGQEYTVDKSKDY